MSQLASSKKNDNDSVLIEHSTPYSGRSLITVRPRRLPVISPLVTAESPLKANGEQFDSPNLFSNTTQEHCDLLANENGDAGICNTANRNESNAVTQNKHVHNSTKKNEDENIPANNKIASYNTANTLAEASLKIICNESSENDLSVKSANSSAKFNCELDIKLLKLSGKHINNISANKKSLSLKDKSTKNNLKINQNVSNRSEDKNVEHTVAQNLSADNKFLNGHGNPEVVCGENKSHLDEICKCTCTQNASNEIENPPCKCKDFDNSLPESSEKVTDFRSENVESLNKYQVQNNSTIAVKHVSNGQFPHETNLISNKDSSKVLLGESLEEDANTIKTYKEVSAHYPKPVYSTNIKAMTKKIAGLRLLDAKVYLNRNEGLRSSGSMTVNNHPNISLKNALQNSLGIEDVNKEEHLASHSRNDLQDLPTCKIHSPTYYPEDDLPPMLSGDAHPPVVTESQLPSLSSGDVQPLNPDVNSEPTQHSLNKNGFSEEVTPKNFETRTPGQHTGKVVKNPNYSSFVVKA